MVRQQASINAKKLIESRNNLGKTQSDIANLIKIPKSTLGMYERGQRVPNDKTIKSLCKVYNVKEEDIIIDKELNSKIIKCIPFNELEKSNLYLDGFYKGGSFGNVKDDPLNKLLRCGNQGGFRQKRVENNNYKDNKYAYVVLYSDFSQLEWNDSIDYETGEVVYYGDNRNPGFKLNEKIGNQILEQVFEDLHNNNRNNIPPFFLFTKGEKGRDVVFRGIAVPGSPNLINSKDDLIAVWSMTNGNRFQNYKAILTILDADEISREWLNDLIDGNFITKNTPEAYKSWIETGRYKPLMAKQKVRYRKKNEQIPKNNKDVELIKTLHDYFEDPFDFEACAAMIFRMMDDNVISWDLTRRWSDGGRDAIGRYRIGLSDNNIEVEFALEAKRYDLNNAVKIKETSRLISRLRQRQFGILVTTSYVHYQAYEEIIDDGHPVIIICANDIIKILKRSGIQTKEDLVKWLDEGNYRNKPIS